MGLIIRGPLSSAGGSLILTWISLVLTVLVATTIVTATWMH